MTDFRVLVTSSRSWDKRAAIWTALDIIATAALESGYDRVVLVHGACPTGGDAHADAWYRAKRGEMPLGVERHPANWDLFGNLAGHIRNADMIRSDIDVCLAAIRNRSKGASKCAEWADGAGITVQLLDYDSVGEL